MSNVWFYAKQLPRVISHPLVVVWRDIRLFLFKVWYGFDVKKWPPQALNAYLGKMSKKEERYMWALHAVEEVWKKLRPNDKTKESFIFTAFHKYYNGGFLSPKEAVAIQKIAAADKHRKAAFNVLMDNGEINNRVIELKFPDPFERDLFFQWLSIKAE